MNTRHSRWFRRAVGGAVIALVSIVGLTGCHRGGWHDPEKAEGRMDHIIEDIQEDLEIRADQEPAYRALTGKIKSHALERMTQRRAAGKELQSVFATDDVDSARVAQILKQQSTIHADRSEVDALIEEAVAFYRTLDAGQQATFNEKVRRMLDRWL
jgi:Spy/CpxP family protein refolding chaperone